MDGDESGMLCLSYMRPTVHIHAVNDTVTAVRDNLMTAVKKNTFLCLACSCKVKTNMHIRSMGLLLKDMLRFMSPWVPRLKTYVCAVFNKMLTEKNKRVLILHFIPHTLRKKIRAILAASSEANSLTPSLSNQ